LYPAAGAGLSPVSAEILHRHETALERLPDRLRAVFDAINPAVTASHA
jgi:hypothetical protein